MTANLDNIHEIYNIFLQKNRMHADIITLFRRFQLSRTLSRLKMEKQQGVSASLLIVLLCLFRMCHESIGSFYSHKFHGLFESGKNCFYRMYNRSSMNWRKLLLRMSVRFMGIVREEEKQNIRNGFNYARKVLDTGESDLLVMDEVLGLVDNRIIIMDELKSLMERRGDTDVILTGILMDDKLCTFADEIYEISAVQFRNFTENASADPA